MSTSTSTSTETETETETATMNPIPKAIKPKPKPPHLHLFPLKNDPKSISQTAKTISLAFSQDPLIRWLRPNAVSWDIPNPEIGKWQYRRVQRAMLEGVVLRSGSVGFLEGVFPRRLSSSSSSSTASTGVQKGNGKVEEKETRLSTTEDSGAVVFLFPPSSQMKWSLSRLVMACKLWILDLLDGVSDGGADEGRITNLMTAHNTTKSRLQHSTNNNLWYLEIIAVHPRLQSRGLGGKVMSYILDYVGPQQSIYLECTREDNVGFYERFGFRVLEKVVLRDQGEECVYWGMVREGMNMMHGRKSVL